jgi:holo-[acyl-carrier protein] synthase
LRDVEVTRLASGQPEIALYDKAAALAAERGVASWMLTLTHTDSMAMAVAVALG